MKEGIFKMLNDGIERVHEEQLIVQEGWRKQRARLQREFPTAKIKYSYKTKQFKIIFGLPSDFSVIEGLNFL